MQRVFRLRVELPDRPGSLAQVAAVIAEEGADVVEIDIHELDGPNAVDEILVKAPAWWHPTRVAASLEESGLGTLLSFAPAHERGDPMYRALSWATSLVSVPAEESDLEFARALTEIVGATSAWVADAKSALSHRVGTMALERRGPVVDRATLDGRSVWMLAVPDSDLAPTVVAFAARSADLKFTATEVARVEALVRLFSVSGARQPQPCSAATAPPS